MYLLLEEWYDVIMLLINYKIIYRQIVGDNLYQAYKIVHPQIQDITSNYTYIYCHCALHYSYRF